MKPVVLMLAFILLALNAPAAEQEDRSDKQLIQDLRQIETMETRIAAMQRRIEAFEARSYSSRLPVLPHSAEAMPPEARSFQFNGMQVWQLPVSADKKQNVKEK